MTLYNKYGQLIEVETNNQGNIYADKYKMEDVVSEIVDYIGESDFEVRLTDGSFRVDAYMTKEMSNLASTANRTVGVSFLINPADIEVCGISFFSVPTEVYEKDGQHGLELNGKAMFLPSTVERETFPQVWELFNKAKEDFKINELDGYAFNKNMYIINDNYGLATSGFIYRSFREIQEELKPVQCFYEYKNPHNKICIRMNADDELRKVTASNDYILDGGQYFSSGKDYADAYRQGIKYDEMRYGNDDTFKNYLSTGNFENEYSVEREEQEYEC